MEGRVEYLLNKFGELVQRGYNGERSLALEQDWLAYEEEQNTFIEEEATEEEETILCKDYWPILESTFMTCSGYRWERAKTLVEKYQTEGRTPELEAEVREFLQGRALSSENELLEEHLPADFFS